MADSLAVIYKADSLKGEAKLELLRNLCFNEVNDLKKALQFAEELINLSEQIDNNYYKAHGYFQKGTKNARLGDLEEAVKAFFRGAEIAKKDKNINLEGSSYGALADIYSISDNHKNAMLYYNKAIATLRKSDDTIALASYILNAGDALLANKEYDSALVYFKESGAIFERVNYAIGKAYNLGNIGMVYANIGKNELAEKNINEAIRILEESGDYHPICVYLIYMSDIYLEKGDHGAALKYAQRSLELGEKYGLKEQIGDANLKLSELYENAGNTKKSLKHYKDYIVYRDSLNNIKSVQYMADLRTNYEVSQKQTEVNLLSQQKKNQRIVVIATVIAMFLIGLIAIGLFRRNKFIQKTKQIIEKEKERSDNLLLNILPEETALELKENGKVLAKKFESVTVLFSDFKGFTKYSENLSPESLVETIGFYFSKFDEITEKYGLEKIKTIGDAYMCAGGLPFPTEDHAYKMVMAAFEIAEFVEKTKKDVEASEMTFDIRIGINTGTVVAGVVGSKKFAYDIWGDTVNVASRMESMSEPGKINVSENTYELIRNEFDCEYRGEIEVKNRGMMKMYFVNNIKIGKLRVF
ncbi:adenylate/guanylate cyclase domain-containing protein [Lutibacter sp.]|uniref:adenylate/guanylate cyclase domain-containing protein n=1 Tax=Lutibacter sp. TaxID=1925666 RepID=UPI003524C43C